MGKSVAHLPRHPTWLMCRPQQLELKDNDLKQQSFPRRRPGCPMTTRDAPELGPCGPVHFRLRHGDTVTWRNPQLHLPRNGVISARREASPVPAAHVPCDSVFAVRSCLSRDCGRRCRGLYCPRDRNGITLRWSERRPPSRTFI